MYSALITFSYIKGGPVNAISTTWQTVEDAAPALVLAVITYLTFWFRSHVGKSNGHGPLNQQTSQIITKLEDLEKRMSKKEDADDGELQ